MIWWLRLLTRWMWLDVVPEDTGTKEALIKKVLDFVDQQESAERIDSDISLNASNNMSLKSGAR